jgi:3-deoxy-D-manno-octulosonic-acid transferase
MSLARGAYSALLILLAPVYLLRLWWRGRREPGYREAIGERFGRYRSGPAVPGFVWVHAVSLGETRAASALVDALRRSIPGMRLLLTHGTATGRQAGRDLVREGDLQCWLPFDTPGATRRFLAHFRPAVGVLMETEVWPNLLASARRAGVPMLLANARLSEKSRAKGARLDALLRPAVESFAAVLAQTEPDARRLRASGAREVEVVGNLKFDLTPEPALVERGRAWHEATGRPVLLFASSREGEEPALLAAWARVPSPRPLLVVVPRHPQRFDEVAAMIEAAGFVLRRRSAFEAAPTAADAAADVWLGDSMREMPLYYGLADAALLGGSFAPLGGQNLIESLSCGCPVVMGPHTFNFAEASELAVEAGAARRVARIEEAVDVALAWLADPAQCRRMAERGVAFTARHRGAAARMAQRVAAHMVK